MNRLPRVADLGPSLNGWGYFLCTQKDTRTGRAGGEFLILTLQDASGQVTGKIFENVQRYKQEFDAGEFVRVEARSGVFQGRLELAISAIRRVNPDQDRLQGFSEDECVMSAPRSIDEMWAELQAHAEAIKDPHVKVLIARLLTDHEAQLRDWPAAQQIHHAYRGGFLEHLCTMMAGGRALATVYGADEDLVIAGVILHDIGKLQELAYDAGRTSYTRDGNLVGHIALGLIMVRETANGIQGFPHELRSKLEHLVLSHHGSREHGSPVEPKTIEAFILAAVDDLDARINQVRRAIREDVNDDEFTSWHKRLGRVLYKG
ncbi:MAG: 3'-5' exoribonuclease YhaM family protein [Vicinamibacterales bacterium]